MSPPGMGCGGVQKDARDLKLKQLAAAGFLEGTRLPTAAGSSRCSALTLQCLVLSRGGPVGISAVVLPRLVSVFWSLG